jgi:hypothetical protein
MSKRPLQFKLMIREGVHNSCSLMLITHSLGHEFLP